VQCRSFQDKSIWLAVHLLSASELATQHWQIISTNLEGRSTVWPVMTAWLNSSLEFYIREFEQSLLSDLSVRISDDGNLRREKISYAVTLFLLALERDCLRLQSSLSSDESHFKVRYVSNVMAGRANMRYRAAHRCWSNTTSI
jgi:hypothetical protein